MPLYGAMPVGECEVCFLGKTGYGKRRPSFPVCPLPTFQPFRELDAVFNSQRVLTHAEPVKIRQA